jgi:MarR family transcriptional regulator, organic hydroperoxide resistance regulator
MSNLPRKQVDEDLYRVMRTVYHYERSLENQFGLGYEEIYVLQYLRRHPQVHLNEVSHELELPMFKCSRLVSRLVEKKLVSKTQDAADRRGIQIVLLSAGEKVVANIEDFSYERVNANICKMGPDDTVKVLQMIEKLDCWLGVSDKIK